MIEIISLWIIAHFCSIGEPITDWYQYVIEREGKLGAVVDTMRLTTSHGIVWIYEWDSGVVFVTNPNEYHGQCARKTDGP